jgi:cation diffusion facilitator CzcD-associated flavoprotein CzcO
MDVALNIQISHKRIPTASFDTVVVGAGPYGLSIAAHLMRKGLKVACFGKPIQFWREQMPNGMCLRSFWWATSLSDPDHTYGIEKYFHVQRIHPIDPLPIETFIDYGIWFQQQVVPNLDEAYIINIEHRNDRFQLTLEDGRIIESTTVVMAPGLQYYVFRPTEYNTLSAEQVSHTADHHKLDQFAGKRVVVIGGGQSALENAALLHEIGAEVKLIARRPINWIPVVNSATPAFVRQLRAPNAGMGNGWLNLLLEKYPYTFQRFPQSTKDYILQTRHGPAGSSWLRKRIEGKITLYEQQCVEKVEVISGDVRLTLTNNTVLNVDHVILGTGYHADITRLPMLHSSLVNALDTYMGSPILNTRFESSISGLYFTGFTAVQSLGPFYRFVVGVDAAARRVASAVTRQVARVR